MSMEKQSITIGEFTYEVLPLGAKVANRVLLKIAKTLGPLFMLMGGGGGLAGAADALKAMSEDDFDWIVDQFAKRTDVLLPDGRAPSLGNPAIFDQHFACRYSEEFAWLEFSIEVNFAPFFRDLKRKAESAKSTPKDASSSTSPST